jgi:hypothetical protein
VQIFKTKGYGMIEIEDRYYTVHGWMFTRFGLGINGANVYAIIYAFEPKGGYGGGAEYLAEFLHLSTRQVQRELAALSVKKLITKTVAETRGCVRNTTYHVAQKPLEFLKITSDTTRDKSAVAKGDNKYINNYKNNAQAREDVFQLAMKMQVVLPVITNNKIPYGAYGAEILEHYFKTHTLAEVRELTADDLRRLFG